AAQIMARRLAEHQPECVGFAARASTRSSSKRKRRVVATKRTKPEVARVQSLPVPSASHHAAALKLDSKRAATARPKRSTHASARALEQREHLGGFRLIERIGEGGMGLVWIAEEVALGRRVALKMVRPEQAWFGGARERFRREVEAVARLQHPGIVPIYAFG